MNPLILPIIPIIISSVSTIIIGISAFLLWKQIKENYEWNRRKTSQETLNNLVTGDRILTKLLNIFEAVTVDIKHDIINENICYEYLGWIMAGYYRWGNPFVIKIRERVGEPRILENFE